ncbi:peptidylprolyl isomerase [Flammeovirga agarivorans]|uniref:peptidylprolyl isomerase n=1 Tax=Flammeovirga agarivorans TaxID=2726742 RepID=A0A7X8XXK0_9BACT|nr:peptidylprolyl isomerase [Flammeovirga agarivorans]NLR93170.1 peptidylprolyl isomerase [Flammeovirga agarivorans]
MSIIKKLNKSVIYYLLIISGLSILSTSCSPKGDGTWEKDKEVPVVVANNDLDFLVTIHTEYGEMKVVLFNDTPLHRENFIKLTRQHYYDSLLFHRVIKNFMIQGGDPDSRFASPNQGLGRGEIGYTIPAEIKDNHYHRKGALAMARKGEEVNPDLESSGCQFYIVDGRTYSKRDLIDARLDHTKLNKYFNSMIEDPEYSKIASSYSSLGANGDIEGQKRLMKKCIPMIEKKYDVVLLDRLKRDEIKAYTTVGGTPFLDGKYTVFGQVVEGFEVIDQIANKQVNRQKRPVESVKMWVSVEEIPKDEVSAMLKSINM